MNPVGPKNDPVYGYPVSRFEADHIVPFDEIMRMPRLVKLQPNEIKEIVNLRENIMGLGKPSNASKGALSWSDWNGYSRLGPVSPDVRASMLQRESEARSALQRALEERLNTNGSN